MIACTTLRESWPLSNLLLKNDQDDLTIGYISTTRQSKELRKNLIFAPFNYHVTILIRMWQNGHSYDNQG